ncbi:hypothetical protein D9M70_626980 [compost metagenome]
MQQGAHHVLFVAPVFQGQGGGLQAVAVAVDRETAKIAGQQFQVGQHALRQPTEEVRGLGPDDVPVFLGAVLHAFECRQLRHGSLHV